MMLELESLATVGALEATEDGGLIVGDQVALQARYFNPNFRAGKEITVEISIKS